MSIIFAIHGPEWFLGHDQNHISGYVFDFDVFLVGIDGESKFTWHGP